MKDRHGTPFCDGGLLRETAEKSIRWLEACSGESGHGPMRRSQGKPRGKLERRGMNPSEVLSFFSQEAEPGLTGSPGPRYFGFVTGGALPASLAADWLSSAWDQNAVLAVSSPAASAAEDIVSEWVLDLLGLPPESSVGFVTGCQMANFTCLGAARHEVLRRSGWDGKRRSAGCSPGDGHRRGRGPCDSPRVAPRMLGLGTGNVISVPVDGQGRMVPEKAEEASRQLPAR